MRRRHPTHRLLPHHRARQRWLLSISLWVSWEIIFAQFSSTCFFQAQKYKILIEKQTIITQFLFKEGASVPTTSSTSAEDSGSQGSLGDLVVDVDNLSESSPAVHILEEDEEEDLED